MIDESINLRFDVDTAALDEACTGTMTMFEGLNILADDCSGRMKRLAKEFEQLWESQRQLFDSFLVYVAPQDLFNESHVKQAKSVFESIVKEAQAQFGDMDSFLDNLFGGDPQSLMEPALRSLSAGVEKPVDELMKTALEDSTGMLSEVLGEVPFGGIASGVLGHLAGQLTQKLFGKDKPQPVVVVNAREIAERIESRVSVTGIDPLSRERGDYRTVSERYAFDELTADQQTQIDRFVNEIYVAMTERTNSIEEQVALQQSTQELRALLIEGLRQAYDESIRQVIEDFDELGRAVGLEGSKIAADVQTIIDGLDASATIQGKTAEEIQSNYKQEYEQSQAAAEALKELNGVLGELEEAAAAFAAAFAETYRKLDPADARELTTQITEAVAGLQGLAGREYADQVLEIRDLVMQRYELEAEEIRQTMELRRQSVSALYDGFRGVIDGVWVNVQGLIPNLQNAFASVLADFDKNAGALGRLNADHESFAWDIGRARHSIVRGYEEKNDAEMIDELWNEFSSLADNPAFGLDRRQAMLRELQSTVLSAYQGTEIGRDDALSQLGRIEGTYNDLYQAELAGRTAEVESSMGDWLDKRVLVGGMEQTIGERYGVSLEDYNLADDASLAQLRADVDRAQQAYIDELQKERDLKLYEVNVQEKDALERQAADTRKLLEFFERLGAERLNRALEELSAVIDAALAGENRIVQVVLDGREIYNNQKPHLLDDSAAGGIRADDDGRLVGQ